MATRAKKTPTRAKKTTKRVTKRKAMKKKATAEAAEAKPTGIAGEVPVRSAPPSEPAGRLVPWGDVERLFDDLLHRRLPQVFSGEWPRFEGFPRFEGLPRLEEIPRLLEHKMPSVDIVDEEEKVTVRAEVPGIDKKDLDVSVTERTLTIKGTRYKEEKEEKGDYFRQEIRTGSISRSVLLPADVDAAKARATLKDGVLELSLPKRAAAEREKISL
jgi:HSP20 family protein